MTMTAEQYNAVINIIDVLGQTDRPSEEFLTDQMKLIATGLREMGERNDWDAVRRSGAIFESNIEHPESNLTLLAYSAKLIVTVEYLDDMEKQ